MLRSILCATLLLSACGQSGALYLPDQAPPPGQQPATQAQPQTTTPPTETPRTEAPLASEPVGAPTADPAPKKEGP
ncbi:MAG TPA: lipoprotein [Solimonas sp.]|nr:lipoprotein [Solimonas sp.]